MEIHWLPAHNDNPVSHDFTITHQGNLTKDEQRALENLRSYDDIIIKQADKGSAVVVMDKVAFIDEAKRHLSDSKVHTLLDRDLTQDIVEKINE